jgi:hypothetical protein
MDAIEGRPVKLECDSVWTAMQYYGIDRARDKVRQVKWTRDGTTVAQYTKVGGRTERVGWTRG